MRGAPILRSSSTTNRAASTSCGWLTSHIAARGRSINGQPERFAGSVPKSARSAPAPLESQTWHSVGASSAFVALKRGKTVGYGAEEDRTAEQRATCPGAGQV